MAGLETGPGGGEDKEKDKTPTFPKPEIKNLEDLRHPTDDPETVICYGTKFALRQSWREPAERESVQKRIQERIDNDEDYANRFYESAIDSLDKETGHGYVILVKEDGSQIHIVVQDLGDDGKWETGNSAVEKHYLGKS